MKLLEWIKTHKVAIVLVIILFFGYQFLSQFFGVSTMRVSLPSSGVANPTLGVPEMADSFGSLSAPASFSLDKRSNTSTSATERLVVQNSNLSLLVKDVREVGDSVLAYAKQAGGFMVSTSYSRPTESPFATITVRVPTAKFDEALQYFRSLAVKVTNENLVGEDVTEQYVDIDERISTLERTKSKFEVILDTATNVQDTLTVQRELINIQTQIDSLKGQKMALEQNANLTKMTVYLSTDELALPYTPDKTLRPDVVFKLAVRSLLNTLRVLAEGAIWVGVYAVIWLPVLVVYLLVRRWRKGRKIV